jgi:hypothetical protein
MPYVTVRGPNVSSSGHSAEAHFGYIQYFLGVPPPFQIPLFFYLLGVALSDWDILVSKCLYYTVVARSPEIQTKRENIQPQYEAVACLYASYGLCEGCKRGHYKLFHV